MFKIFRTVSKKDYICTAAAKCFTYVWPQLFRRPAFGPVDWLSADFVAGPEPVYCHIIIIGI